jgi:hypothetical protein
MEKIGNRILIEDGEDAPSIRIVSYRERWKQHLLVAWIAIWTICGALVASRLFVDIPAKEKLSFTVFLAFWAYFEYMTVHAALWRAYGEERLWVENGELVLVHAIGSREKLFRYPLESLGQLHFIEGKEGSFSEHFEDSYYVKGRMRLGIEYGDRMVRFGEKLSDEDARNLLRRMKAIPFLPS